MTNLRNYWKPIVVFAFAITSTLLLASWNFKNDRSSFIAGSDQQIKDTVPTKKDSREKKVRDLDDVLEELEEAQIKIDKELKLDMEKLKKEIEASFNKVEMDKIKAEIEQGLKEIDIEKMRREMEASIAKIDWDKIKQDLDKVKEIDFSKMEMDMKKMEEEMKKIGPEIEKSMEKAKEGIEKAKVEMKEYKNFVDGLDKDGLIDKKKEYNIRHEDGELFINGKKQLAEVYNKYRKFLEKHKTFNINKESDDFDIDID